MRGRMQGLWADVVSAEEGIGNGEPGALDKFIYSAGTMIETFRLAKSNFGKNRVSLSSIVALEGEVAQC
jgi:general transcription factor 3C polypeptide 3 (transcription factor C subunit 4)